ncbi:MAG: hypothetical protein CSA09_03220 [Candidatus Contendobacter odensis]|uniref:Uncharacterized protein n=1 Tax=Candidatus Contendibacter odensensis TaxID=1400860 RepID=A0A2G6PEX4_9GAMM|nr:MAG: hypothetical protein CSA09_03220 [Candidatus Contendobacter odensis]
MSSAAVQTNTTRHRQLVSVTLIILPLLMGANDDFLFEIEEEAKRQATTLRIDTDDTVTTPVSTDTGENSASERLPSGLDQAAFEHAFSNLSPKVFSFYKKLDTNAKMQIYKHYKNDQRLSTISDQIVRLLTRKP